MSTSFHWALHRAHLKNDGTDSFNIDQRVQCTQTFARVVLFQLRSKRSSTSLAIALKRTVFMRRLWKRFMRLKPSIKMHL